jgi:hypothetical protein
MQDFMEWDMFIKIVDELSQRDYEGWIALHNYNEPLMNPRLLEEIRAIRSRLQLAKVSIFTNGDHLDAQRLNDLEQAGTSHIRVTLYPAKGKMEVDEGASETRLNRWLTAKKLHNVEWLMIPVRQGLSARATIGHIDVDVIVPNLSTYNYRGGTAKAIEGRERSEPCYMTYHSAAIDFRGSLKMCCNVYPHDARHSDYVVGSLGSTSFWDLWEGPIMSEFRQQHRTANWERSPICSMCTHELPADQVKRYKLFEQS